MRTENVSKLIALVGRTNVGKSTLFNRILRKNKNVIEDSPGTTRDRIIAEASFKEHTFMLCDTGGFEPFEGDVIKKQLVTQSKVSIENAAVVILVTDRKSGLVPAEEELLSHLRKLNKTFVIAVNKCDTDSHDNDIVDFLNVGAAEVFPISAEHGRGVGNLLEYSIKVLNTMKLPKKVPKNEEDVIRLALIGRPNVGKSSILNKICGEDRSVVSDIPGTTRDAVDVTLNYHGTKIVLVDTAGIRRQAKTGGHAERFSITRSMAVIKESDVVVLVVDAEAGPTSGDERVLGYAFELRKPTIIVVNKWDLIKDKDSKSTKRMEEAFKHEMRFFPEAPFLFVSAATNLRVAGILSKTIEMHKSAQQKFSTSFLNKTLQTVLQSNTPPLKKNRSGKIKFFYVTQTSTSPIEFIIFCSHPKEVPQNYMRYLEASFRKLCGCEHIPIRIDLRGRAEKKGEEG